jgi:hypothetical protein
VKKLAQIAQRLSPNPATQTPHLQQVELVDPEDLLGAPAVVHHAGLGGQLRLLVQQPGLELGLHRLNCQRKNKEMSKRQVLKTKLYSGTCEDRPQLDRFLIFFHLLNDPG